MPKADPQVLNKRRLNRALLARQMLLSRETVHVTRAIERLVGMQAQVPRPPFVGLWTRIEKFQRDQLLEALRARKVVRATAMRGTIHLMSAKDFLSFRPLLSEMLVKGAQTIAGKKIGKIDVAAIYATGRDFFGRAPAPFEDFRRHLESVHPKLDVRAMAYTVRMGVPLVMVPSDVTWGFPADAGFTLAESWLGAEVPETSSALQTFVLRYLTAFGPATPGDFQTWSGLRGSRETFETLRPKLVTFRDERKRELFDLPKAPRPAEDEPAPVRFLPDFDNALLGHDDRSRIIADEHRKHVFLKNLQILGTVLVDGFVSGIWRLERKRKTSVLAVKPFALFPRRVATAVQQEGESLLTFLEPDAVARSVTIGKQP